MNVMLLTIQMLRKVTWKLFIFGVQKQTWKTNLSAYIVGEG